MFVIIKRLQQSEKYIILSMMVTQATRKHNNPATGVEPAMTGWMDDLPLNYNSLYCAQPRFRGLSSHWLFILTVRHMPDPSSGLLMEAWIRILLLTPYHELANSTPCTRPKFLSPNEGVGSCPSSDPCHKLTNSTPCTRLKFAWFLNGGVGSYPLLTPCHPF